MGFKFIYLFIGFFLFVFIGIWDLVRLEVNLGYFVKYSFFLVFFILAIGFLFNI